MFDRFSQRGSKSCQPLSGGGVSANTKLRHLSTILRGGGGGFRASLFFPVVRRTTNLTNIPCKHDTRDSMTLGIVSSRAHTVAGVVTSKVLPSGRNHNCMLEHMLHHTMECNGLVNVSSTFLNHVVSIIMGVVGPTCPRLVRGRTFVGGITNIRRGHFRTALGTKVSLLTRVLRRALGGRQHVLANSQIFGLCSACKFP